MRAVFFFTQDDEGQANHSRHWELGPMIQTTRFIRILIQDNIIPVKKIRCLRCPEESPGRGRFRRYEEWKRGGQEKYL